MPITVARHDGPFLAHRDDVAQPTRYVPRRRSPGSELSDGGFGDFSANVLVSLACLGTLVASAAYAAFVAVIFVLWLNSDGYTTVSIFSHAGSNLRAVRRGGALLCS